jgi:hypothetical protein
MTSEEQLAKIIVEATGKTIRSTLIATFFIGAAGGMGVLALLLVLLKG